MSAENHDSRGHATLEQLEQLSPEQFALLCELARVCVERHEQSGEEARESQPEFEKTLRSATKAFECGIHKSDIERLDVDVPGILVDGQRYMFIRKSPQEVLVSAGKIYPVLSVYRRRGGHGGDSVVPAAMSLGLINGSVSLVAGQICQAYVAEMPPEIGARLLKQVGMMAPSKSWLGSIVTEVGKVWEANRREFEEQVRLEEIPSLPARESVVTIQFSLDGVMVPDKDAPRTPGATKDDPRPKGHREAYCASICFLDADGERLDTKILARMPEARKVTLVEQIIDELRHIKACYPNARWQAVADAAAENWRIVAQVAKELDITFILTVDFYHAAEHLTDGLKAGGITDDNKLKFWRETLMLQPDGVDRCLEEFNRVRDLSHARRSKKRLATIDRQITYFTNQRTKMNYVELLDAGYGIGSGVQEAIGKSVLVQRMKQSGMSWRRPGGQAVLTARALQRSGRLEHSWVPLSRSLRRPWSVDPDTKRLPPPWSQRRQNLSS